MLLGPSRTETPMRTAPPMARQKLIELLRLTPEPHMREGYVMVLRNAVDDYVRTILYETETAGEYSR